MKNKITTLLSLLIFFLLPASLPAGEIIVGVAANFISPFKEIAKAFEQKNHIPVTATFSSTGNLYGQIRNGAPYDLFLAADEWRPDVLFDQKIAEMPFVYAEGQVVLWSLHKEMSHAKDWRTIILKPEIKRIAMANPKTAPYGAAAVAALKGSHLWEDIQNKLIFGQNIAQVFQYTHTEVVDAGFCALSSATSDKGKKGYYFPIPEAPPIIQAACILHRTKNREEVELFSQFLVSPEAQRIKKQYGYK